MQIRIENIRDNLKRSSRFYVEKSIANYKNEILDI